MNNILLFVNSPNEKLAGEKPVLLRRLMAELLSVPSVEKERAEKTTEVLEKRIQTI